MNERQRWSIFLDLDNTILDFSWAEKRALLRTRCPDTSPNSTL